jgi:hypothetical protein
MLRRHRRTRTGLANTSGGGSNTNSALVIISVQSEADGGTGENMPLAALLVTTE